MSVQPRSRPDGSPTAPVPRLRPGTPVEVRSTLAGWAPGFVVVDHTEDGYRLRRCCDGTELPVPLPAERVRPAT